MTPLLKIRRVLVDTGALSPNEVDTVGDQIMALLPVLPEHDCAAIAADDVTITAAQQIRLEAVRLTLAHRMHDSIEKLIDEALQIAKAVETGDRTGVGQIEAGGLSFGADGQVRAASEQEAKN